MARTFVVNTGAVALSASATKHLILVNPTITFLCTEFGISFDATTATSAILVELYRTTTIGTPAGTTATVTKVNAPSDSASSNATSSTLTALTTAPTAYEVIRGFYLQPFGGLWIHQFPLGREPQASGSSSNRFGIAVTTPSGVTCNAKAWIEWEE